MNAPLMITVEIHGVPTVDDEYPRLHLLAHAEDSIQTLFNTVQRLAQAAGVPTAFVEVSFDEADDFFNSFNSEV